MKRSAHDLLLSLQTTIAPSCREWMRVNRPDAERLLREASQALTDAALLGDASVFAEAVRVCSGMHLQVACIHRTDARRTLPIPSPADLVAAVGVGRSCWI